METYNKFLIKTCLNVSNLKNISMDFEDNK